MKPSYAFPPPSAPRRHWARLCPRVILFASAIALFTSVAGNTGRPQISLPLVEVDGLPIGLSLLGDYGADERLIALAVELGSAS